jgi:2-iminobutanoate/2-iminopropanoate deaminase
MKIKPVQTDQAPAAIGPYSQGISVSPWLFVSGQLGMNPETGELVGPELKDQARQAIQNLEAVIRAAGGSLRDVVAVDVFLTEIRQFMDFNAIYQEYFTDHRPARAVVEVGGLPKGGCVEIKCIAMIRTTD